MQEPEIAKVLVELRVDKKKLEKLKFAINQIEESGNWIRNKYVG